MTASRYLNRTFEKAKREVWEKGFKAGLAAGRAAVIRRAQWETMSKEERLQALGGR